MAFVIWAAAETDKSFSGKNKIYIVFKSVRYQRFRE